MSNAPRIGILALQGGFSEHASFVERAGGTVQLIRQAGTTDSIDALIIPGGESTVMARFIEAYQIRPWLEELHHADVPMLGTCAGAILLSDTPIAPGLNSLNFVPATMRRNAYGRQTDSFSEKLNCTFPGQPPCQTPAAFIRAPRVLEHHAEVIAERPDGEPVGLLHHNTMILTFHPELTEDITYHRHLCRLTES